MACISIGKFKKKLLFPMLAIIFCFIIYNMEYFSGFFFDLKKNVKSPKLYSLYFSFSFLGCFLYGGIFLFISNSSSSRESKLALDKTKKDKNKKDLRKKKGNSPPSLIYDEEISKIHINIIYFIISAFLELLLNFSFASTVFDFLDFESKILYGAFEIIFIKIISKCIFKFQFYRHQILSLILLVIVLLMAIMTRETFLMKIVRKQMSFYIKEFEKFLIETTEEKLRSGIIYYNYFIFIMVGLLARSFSVCFDKWLITSKLCDPYKLLFFKGLFGLIPSFCIQILLYFIIGENFTTDDSKDISIKNLYKRLSFPFSSFIHLENIIFIITFFILVGAYYTFTIIVINGFKPEFIGFVSIVSSTLTLLTIQVINSIMTGKKHQTITIILIHFFFFVLILIPSLILCEIIILHFCKCDKYISSNIERRASIEVNTALKLYNDEEDEDDSKNMTFNSEDISNKSNSTS
jgi:hypothetical protein